MPVIAVRIPQLGEGLQEALLVEFLKKPGDSVQRDEPIYVMETDKATTDVESPFAGTLIEWTVQPGSVMEIGSEIGRMEVAEGIKEMPQGHAASSSSSSSSNEHPQLTYQAEPSQFEPAGASARGSEEASAGSSSIAFARSDIVIPPRTRKYLKDTGLLEHIDKIPVRGTKMMPEDVDAFLATMGSGISEIAGRSQIEVVAVNRETPQEPHQIVSLPKSQVTLNYRMSRGCGVCIPVTVVTEIDWTAMERIRKAAMGPLQTYAEGAATISGQTGDKFSDAPNTPTGFAIACWAVVQAMKQHRKFRSVLTSDGTAVKVFSHVNLGVAVALPGDEMLTAVIRRADLMSAEEFYRAYSIQVDAVRRGQDQADETTTLTVSNIGKAGMRIGIPAIVAPAVATLALGQVFQWPIPVRESFQFRSTVTATLSFDHRIVNGVGAANFLNDVRRIIESARDFCLTSGLQ